MIASLLFQAVMRHVRAVYQMRKTLPPTIFHVNSHGEMASDLIVDMDGASRAVITEYLKGRLRASGAQAYCIATQSRQRTAGNPAGEEVVLFSLASPAGKEAKLFLLERGTNGRMKSLTEIPIQKREDSWLLNLLDNPQD
jgi:hypothetical protein